ncbi:MAG: class I SAM-dependent methyltransferase [Cryomorphaceae bacterium]
MKNTFLFFILFFVIGCSPSTGQNETDTVYTLKSGDQFGTGKWYMGREIAYVMGFHGMDWLERPEREEEENVSKLLKNLDLQPTDVVADIGAGSGYHVFRMAPKLREGKVYAVDIQQEMLDVMQSKIDEDEVENVELIKGEEKTTNLPPNSVDKILMVDVYHEFSFPREMIESMKQALKPDGAIYLIEYRREDDWVPIKTVHKMTEEQAVKEFEALGFYLDKNIGNLPWQHCMIFRVQK